MKDHLRVTEAMLVPSFTFYHVYAFPNRPSMYGSITEILCLEHPDYEYSAVGPFVKVVNGGQYSRLVDGKWKFWKGDGHAHMRSLFDMGILFQTYNWHSCFLTFERAWEYHQTVCGLKDPKFIPMD